MQQSPEDLPLEAVPGMEENENQGEVPPAP
jgi:hypothetical protein